MTNGSMGGMGTGAGMAGPRQATPAVMTCRLSSLSFSSLLAFSSSLSSPDESSWIHANTCY